MDGRVPDLVCSYTFRMSLGYHVHDMYVYVFGVDINTLPGTYTVSCSVYHDVLFITYSQEI